MNVTLLLCDHAVVAEGKLFINGAGWDSTSSPTAPFSIAVLMWLPSDLLNTRLAFTLGLYDAAGAQVQQQGEDGSNTPIELSGEFEIAPPPGVISPATLPVPMAFSIPPLGLPPGGYYWQFGLNGEADPNWRYSFTTRPQPRPAGSGGPTDFTLP